MSNIKGTNVASAVAPFSEQDNYATHDAKYGKGGYKSVQTLADRDKIPKNRLDDGCMVFVRENNTKYIFDASTQTFTKDSQIAPNEELEIDSELSEYSENPVKNAVITKRILALEKKGGCLPLTQEEYNALEEYDFSTIYAIIKNDEVKAIYIGKTLIASSGGSNRFPYSLPINF